MADIDKALRYKILQDAGVVALIVDRFYAVTLPQTVVLPAVTYQSSAGKITSEHGSRSVLPRPRYQIKSWSDEFQDVVAIDIAIKNVIDGQRGNWGTGSYITFVDSCLNESVPRDDRDSITGLYTRSRDYLIMYKEN